MQYSTMMTITAHPLIDTADRLVQISLIIEVQQSDGLQFGPNPV